MRMVDPLLQELEQEAAATKRLLERVPGDKLAWKPHEKSMTLGQLALHIATIPGNVAGIAVEDEMPLPEFGNAPAAEKAEELVPALDESLASARKILGGMDDAKLLANWKVVKDGQAVMEMPRAGLLRGILLNHWYHHRGQLTVYLRLLEVPLPATYGASADENPFKQA